MALMRTAMIVLTLVVVVIVGRAQIAEPDPSLFPTADNPIYLKVDALEATITAMKGLVKQAIAALPRKTTHRVLDPLNSAVALAESAEAQWWRWGRPKAPPVVVGGGGEINAASCSRADVNTALGTAVSGNTVVIPGTSCTWTSGVTIPDGVTLKGTGTPTTASATMGPSGTCAQTVLTINSVTNAFVMDVGTHTTATRLSCLKLRTDDEDTIGPPITAYGTCDASTCPPIRIDNITFDTTLQGCCDSQSNSLITVDNVSGVIDHNRAEGTLGVGPGVPLINYNNSAWKGVGAFGDSSWYEASNFGGANLLYLENNYLGEEAFIGETEAQVPGGGQGGGRIAARFNECNGCISGLSNHGTDSNGRPRGGRQIEFYGNTFICGNEGGCQGAVPVRSGVNLVFGNTLNNRESPEHTWFNQYISLGVFRIDVIWSNPWGQCPGTYDQAGPPVMCTDQPSRSGGTLLSGSTPSPTGWTNQTIDPTYEWNNAGYNPVFGNVSTGYSTQLQANRDWYTDGSLGSPVAQTSSSSPFSGATGVGFGIISRRPSTCTTGVVYWATDEGSWNTSGNAFGNGRLYKCTATNTWTLAYTPYAYPHPLVVP